MQNANHPQANNKQKHWGYKNNQNYKDKIDPKPSAGAICAAHTIMGDIHNKDLGHDNQSEDGHGDNEDAQMAAEFEQLDYDLTDVEIVDYNDNYIDDAFLNEYYGGSEPES
jgi:hypothetical protein